MSRNERVSCESCTYYIYDEDYESYVSDKNMDEDEYYPSDDRSSFPVSVLQKW